MDERRARTGKVRARMGVEGACTVGEEAAHGLGGLER
jgi:hypothetical protein